MKRKLRFILLGCLLLNSCENNTNYPEQEYKDSVQIFANSEECSYFLKFEYDDYIFGFDAGDRILITNETKEVDVNIDFDEKYVESITNISLKITTPEGAFKEPIFDLNDTNKLTVNLDEYRELYESFAYVDDDKDEFAQQGIPFVDKMITNALYRFVVTVMFTSGYKGYYCFSLTYGNEAYYEDGTYKVFL